MARALVIQHVANEGLGLLTEWLPAFGVDVHPTHPYLGHRVPTSVEGDALVVLGGPMGVTDDEAAPWLPAVRDLLASAVEDGVPTLGICLGAQLLAVAAGGDVNPGEQGPEFGVDEVQVVTSDPLFDVGSLSVVQWHHDVVTRLPDGAELLASNARYRNQAFRVGDVAWGMQFHIEATPELIATWVASSDASATVIDEVAAAADRLAAAGERLAKRFATVVTG